VNRIILDANYIIAILDKRDVFHKNAMAIKERLHQIRPILVFFDCVINEVVSVLVKRLSERRQIYLLSGYLKELNILIPKEKITWSYLELDEYYESIIHLVEKSDGSLNFHDAFIVLLANDMEIGHIVSFDKGFDRTGLRRISKTGDI
jgi:predicted nucleic acid-binding protein